MIAKVIVEIVVLVFVTIVLMETQKMGIYREVYTDVTCDKCGEQILAWKSCGQGVSKG